MLCALLRRHMVVLAVILPFMALWPREPCLVRDARVLSVVPCACVSPIASAASCQGKVKSSSNLTPSFFQPPWLPLRLH